MNKVYVVSSLTGVLYGAFDSQEIAKNAVILSYSEKGMPMFYNTDIGLSYTLDGEVEGLIHTVDFYKEVVQL